MKREDETEVVSLVSKKDKRILKTPKNMRNSGLCQPILSSFTPEPTTSSRPPTSSAVPLQLIAKEERVKKKIPLVSESIPREKK